MPKLTANVYVDGAWYGPDYPDAGTPPADAVTNPAAFEDAPPSGPQPFRADDLAAVGQAEDEGDTKAGRSTSRKG